MIQLFFQTGQSVSPYAVCAACGLVTALLYILLMAPRQDLDREDCAYLYAWGILGMGIGAKLLYLLQHAGELAASVLKAGLDPTVFYRQFLAGGFVFYGGLAGILAGTRLAAGYFRQDWEAYMPLFVPAFCFFHVWGRIGCYLAGCCYGRDGIPVQLLEAAGVLVIGLGLHVRARRIQRDKTAAAGSETPSRSLPVRGEASQGRVYLRIYLLCYASLRFLLEFWRGDPERGFLGPISVSQWISLAILFLLLLSYKHSAGDSRPC